MTVQEIVKLVNAGFTKSEIIALGADQPAPEEQPTPAPAPKPAPAPTPEPAPAPAPAPEKAAPELPAEVANALANINATLAKLQAFAVKTDAQPPQPKDGDYKSILSSVYNKKE